VKSLGDGVMLAFAEAADAVAGGLALVGRAGRHGLPPARAGVASGPVVPRDGDLFGRTVNLAARLLDHARPGELLVTREVADAAGAGTGAAFREIGPVSLKGLAEPVAVLGAWVPGAEDVPEHRVDPPRI
jgi:class 3 adenylate cyclase